MELVDGRAAVGAARRRPADRPRAGPAAGRAGRRGAGRRARGRHRAPRREAGQPAGHPRRPGQGHRLRHRPRRGRGRRSPMTGQVIGTPHYLSPGAGRGRAGDGRERRLRARRGALRVPRRASGRSRRHPGRDGAGARPRGRSRRSPTDVPPDLAAVVAPRAGQGPRRPLPPTAASSPRALRDRTGAGRRGAPPAGRDHPAMDDRRPAAARRRRDDPARPRSGARRRPSRLDAGRCTPSLACWPCWSSSLLLVDPAVADRRRPRATTPPAARPRDRERDRPTSRPRRTSSCPRRPGAGRSRRGRQPGTEIARAPT